MEIVVARYVYEIFDEDVNMNSSELQLFFVAYLTGEKPITTLDISENTKNISVKDFTIIMNTELYSTSPQSKNVNILQRILIYPILIQTCN